MRLSQYLQWSIIGANTLQLVQKRIQTAQHNRRLRDTIHYVEGYYGSSRVTQPNETGSPKFFEHPDSRIPPFCQLLMH